MLSTKLLESMSAGGSAEEAPRRARARARERERERETHTHTHTHRSRRGAKAREGIDSEGAGVGRQGQQNERLECRASTNAPRAVHAYV